MAKNTATVTAKPAPKAAASKAATAGAAPKPAGNPGKGKAQVAAPAAAQTDDDLTLDDGAPAATTEATESDDGLGDPADEPAAAEATEDAGEGEVPAEEGSEPAETPAAAEGQQADGSFPLDEKFSQVIQAPVDQLTPGSLRTPTEAQIAEMALSIQKQGLQNPIIISEDGVVLAGNTRLAAYKKLGLTVIPARVATDLKGNPIQAKDHAAIFTSVIENVRRNDLTPMQLGNAYRAMIKSGIAENHKALAKEMGLSPATVSNAILVIEKGTPVCTRPSTRARSPPPRPSP